MLKILFSVLVVEAVTNIISKSEIFLPLRRWLFKRNTFFHDLLTCPYCLSVWVGVFMAVFLGIKYKFVDNIWIDYFLSGLVLHRLSNVCHHFIDILERVMQKGIVGGL